MQDINLSITVNIEDDVLEKIKDLTDSFKANYIVSQAAWNYYQAVRDAKIAKQAYLDKLEDYDKLVARKSKKRIEKIKPVWSKFVEGDKKVQGVFDYTAEAYNAYQKAQKKANYLKTKLLNTIKKEFVE